MTYDIKRMIIAYIVKQSILNERLFAYPVSALFTVPAEGCDLSDKAHDLEKKKVTSEITKAILLKRIRRNDSYLSIAVAAQPQRRGSREASFVALD